MQMTVDDFLMGVINGHDTYDIDNEDFGFNYPVDYVIRTWQVYLNMRILPRFGGYDDQDEQLMNDWQTLNRRMAYLRRKLNGDNDTSAHADIPPDALSL